MIVENRAPALRTGLRAMGLNPSDRVANRHAAGKEREAASGMRTAERTVNSTDQERYEWEVR